MTNYQKQNCTLFDIYNYNVNSSPKILFIAGTHGNEPAGYYSLINYNFSKTTKNITVIPNVNPCGLQNDTRTNPYTYKDMNREYGKFDIQNFKIEQIVLQQDLIIDFHEGFDYHLRNSNAIGATLSSKTEKI